MMANFVLVHGAWHGAWCWSRIQPALVRLGHVAHAVTLTGVGERAHLLSKSITLETHIADVIGLIEAEELQDIVLVVHSYAGMLGTAVADRMPQRLKHVAYLDAAIPEPGESWSARHTPDTREGRISAATASPHYTLPPPDPAIFGLSGADRAWVQRRQTPHPAEPYTHVLNFDAQRVASVPRTFIDCINPPLATIDSIRQRVRNPQFWGGAWQHGGRVVVMDAGHDPMVSAPDELLRVLLDCASIKTVAPQERQPPL
jgi:pimeloyl-ACP methyl ester carboxylesterase